MNLTKQPWVLCGDDIWCEYLQCKAEGKKVEQFEEVCRAVEKIPDSYERNEVAKTLFTLMEKASEVETFTYDEPEEYEAILAARPKYDKKIEYNGVDLEDKIRGAWRGRFIGCLLGKPIEGIRLHQLELFMKETDNFPPRKFFEKKMFDEEDMKEKLRKCSEEYHECYFDITNRCWADTIDGIAPADDDVTYPTNVLLFLRNYYGKDFTPQQMLYCIMNDMGFFSCCTAERIARINGAAGYLPPETAKINNPYREFLGARIRIDVFGYVCPGKPEEAAYLAFKDAQWSHVKNGVYSAMFVAAMISAAYTEKTAVDIIKAGLAQIPENCRLAEAVRNVMEWHAAGVEYDEVVKRIHADYDNDHIYGWCHAIPNDMIVVAALLYSNLDFTEALALSVRPAFDTDCNGATVGSIVGIVCGGKAIPAHWCEGWNDTQKTFLSSAPVVTVDQVTQYTLEIINKG